MLAYQLIAASLVSQQRRRQRQTFGRLQFARLSSVCVVIAAAALVLVAFAIVVAVV